MNNIILMSYLSLFLPFLAFLINALLFHSSRKKHAAYVSIVLSGFGFLSALYIAVFYFQSGIAPGKLILWEHLFLKFTDSLHAHFAFLLDPLSIMMVVVVSFISFVVNLYSLTYMKDDPSFSRFFTFLSLFSFSMLGLVVASNLFQMFFFWELVGISSYLLIGFWYQKPSAVKASKQAFVLTRFADSFFLLGIVLISYIASTFSFETLNSLSLSHFSGSINLGFISISKLQGLFLSSILIFIGGWGKSAMFPMHIWLPNAMEGPTPVSSIIHSATMVVAGVYLVARLFPFFALFPSTLHLIMVLGIITAVFAAVIAITQKDIKRILAFSTLSQLGYMLFALGVTSVVLQNESFIHPLGYSASIFHIFTHAFFKCMLFLIAGSLIHAVHSNSLEAMGGLKNKMPWTYAAAIIGVLAISGLPPFSGFFSKDEILIAAFQSEHFIVFALALVTSALTAFYMFRFFFLAFHGKPRSNSTANVKESFGLSFPILLLAIPSFFGGYAFKKLLFQYYGPGSNNLNVFEKSMQGDWIPFASSFIVLVSIFLAWYFYARPYAKIQKSLDSSNRPRFYKWIYHQFYFDEIYDALVQQFLFKGIAQTIRFFEDYIIGGLLKLFLFVIQKLGSLVRELQSGWTPFYLGLMIFGVLMWSLIAKLPI